MDDRSRGDSTSWRVVALVVCAPCKVQEKVIENGKDDFVKAKDIHIQLENPEQSNSNNSNGGTATVSSVKEEPPRFSSVKPPPSLNEFLLHTIQLGIILLFFYYSDYVKVCIFYITYI